jgi:hypothetical protein
VPGTGGSFCAASKVYSLTVVTPLMSSISAAVGVPACCLISLMSTLAEPAPPPLLGFDFDEPRMIANPTRPRMTATTAMKNAGFGLPDCAMTLSLRAPGPG